MLKIVHAFTFILISLTAVLPNNLLVVCEQEDGSVSIEFRTGELCACDLERLDDELEKTCCDEIDCHEDEELTAACHEVNQINSGDCNDTELVFTQVLSSVNRIDNYILSAVYSPLVQYTNALITTRSLLKPFDVGKEYQLNNDIINHALLLKETTVFLI